MKTKAVFNWSGGKDSALALQKTLEENEFEVASLLTAIKEETLKSPLHGVPLDVLYRQAESIGIPLYPVLLAENFRNHDHKMHEAVAHFKKQGVTSFIFGDIFLPDIKAYRENKLNPVGIEVVEPLWDKSSSEVIEEFLNSDIRSKVIVARSGIFDKTVIGKELDTEFIASLAKGIDACGENGEYHTLSYAGGLFTTEVEFEISEVNLISYDIHSGSDQIEKSEYWQAELHTHP